MPEQFENTLADLQECRALMDFPPRTRREAEARLQLIQLCVEMARTHACILSEDCPP
jgi:hypothetical protein